MALFLFISENNIVYDIAYLNYILKLITLLAALMYIVDKTSSGHGQV